MTSILTNTSATSALATLQAVNSQLTRNQDQISSGLRVASASDNAAYWSIATIMRSDTQAISAASDAIALGSATIDTAYSGVDSVIDLVSQFRSKIVSAMEPGVDKTKIQSELDQLKQQVVSIADSSSFSGQNWLSTNFGDLYDPSEDTASLVSSFVRTGSSVELNKTTVDLQGISLFNTGGGGILQADDRSTGTIGGLRNTDVFTDGSGSIQNFTFSGPLNFTDNSTAITFTMVIDADDPSTTPSPGPGNTVTVRIDRSTVDQADPSLNGVVSTRDQFANVMRTALQSTGAIFSTMSGSSYGYALLSNETSGLTGSSIQVTSVASTLAGGKTGGLQPTGTSYGARPAVISYWDQPFRVDYSAEIHVPISINGTTTLLDIDRQTVNDALGTNDGMVNSSDDLAAVLNDAMSKQNLGLTATSEGSYLLYQEDPTILKEAGSKTSLGIGPAYDDFNDLPDFGLLDVDVTTPSGDLDHYLTGVDGMLDKLTAAGSTLGSLKQRSDQQADFTNKLLDSLNSGIGKLVDADMEQASAKLNAFQTQQQLALQSLQVANSQPQVLLKLFQ
jgi:flagellin